MPTTGTLFSDMQPTMQALHPMQAFRSIDISHLLPAYLCGDHIECGSCSDSLPAAGSRRYSSNVASKMIGRFTTS